MHFSTQQGMWRFFEKDVIVSFEMTPRVAYVVVSRLIVCCENRTTRVIECQAYIIVIVIIQIQYNK